jgi:urease subunit gamma/beta
VIEVEALFPWGSVLVHVDAPFRAPDPSPERPGATVTAPGSVALAAGLPRRTVVLRNTGPRDVWISSHFPLDQVNPAVAVSGGGPVAGCRLDLPAGEALLLRPGESRSVAIVVVATAASSEPA